MKNLYAYYMDCGRMGHVEGRFRAMKEEARALIGKYIYFGGILGKHSEICGNIEKKEIILLSDNEQFLKIADELEINLESGYNPLHYYRCGECDAYCNVITGKCVGCGAIRED